MLELLHLMFYREAYISGALLEASKEVFEGFVELLGECLEFSIYTSLFVAIAVLFIKLVEALLSRVEAKRRVRGVRHAHKEALEHRAAGT